MAVTVLRSSRETGLSQLPCGSCGDSPERVYLQHRFLEQWRAPQFTESLSVWASCPPRLTRRRRTLWITGTISTSPYGSESLEVVFALKPVCWVLGACGTIELICCGFWDIDEEETPINRVAEEVIWETSWPVSSAFVPATDKDLFAHYPQDQNS